MGQTARLRLIQDRFIAGHSSGELRRYLDSDDDKTELMIFGSKRQLTNLHDITLRVGDMNIAPSAQVRNLGVQYDSSLTMEKHVNAVCRVARMHLRNISRIRAYLTIDATRSLVNSTVTSRLDYANSRAECWCKDHH